MIEGGNSMHQPSSTAKADVIDPAVEAALNEYIAEVLESEKGEFKPGLEPFTVHANKLRQSISNAVHSFQKSYDDGYRALLKELARKHPQKDPTVDPLAPYYVDPQTLNIPSDPLAFMQALDEGKSLQELFGFSVDAMAGFYDAAHSLYENCHFPEARDGFFFLVTMAPRVNEFWLALAHAYISCKEYDSALQASNHVIELAPHLAVGYLTSARAYLEIKKLNDAQAVCDQGLSLALANRGIPWAEELGTMLEEAKRQIATHRLKS